MAKSYFSVYSSTTGTSLHKARAIFQHYLSSGTRSFLPASINDLINKHCFFTHKLLKRHHDNLIDFLIDIENYLLEEGNIVKKDDEFIRAIYDILSINNLAFVNESANRKISNDLKYGCDKDGYNTYEYQDWGLDKKYRAPVSREIINKEALMNVQIVKELKYLYKYIEQQPNDILVTSVLGFIYEKMSTFRRDLAKSFNEMRMSARNDHPLVGYLCAMSGRATDELEDGMVSAFAVQQEVGQLQEVADFILEQCGLIKIQTSVVCPSSNI